MGEGKWSTAKPQTTEKQSAASGNPPGKKGGGSSGFGGFSLEGHYAECYPGMAEEYDATYDSDDEADYTKMDMVGVASCQLTSIGLYMYNYTSEFLCSYDSQLLWW